MKQVIFAKKPKSLSLFKFKKQSYTVRTRYAPSPTGSMHLGGLRTALFCYLYAKKHAGQFLLRIEDTDRTRFKEDSLESIMNSLAWLGIEYDEGPVVGGSVGPYFQSERTEVYREHVDRLLEDGHAYKCFCTAERLDNLRKSCTNRGISPIYDRYCLNLDDKTVKENVENGVPYVVRLKIPAGGSSVEDVVYGALKFNHNFLSDSIILKSDKFPTYHLANVVDDHLMGISHVIRGEEWVPSLPIHLSLYQSFGWDAPKFVHLPLLLNQEGKKLSKRNGDFSMEHYKEAGYLPEAVLNSIALLGWNPGTAQEVFTKQELISNFNLEQINKSGARVDLDKMKWINGLHTRRLLIDDPARILCSFNQKLNQFIQKNNMNPIENYDNPEYVQKVLSAVEERVNLIDELVELSIPYFVDLDFESDEAKDTFQSVKRSETSEILQSYLKFFKEETFNEEQFQETSTKISKNLSLKKGIVMKHARYALTGRKQGVDLTKFAGILPQEEIVKRFNASIKHLGQ